jgi:type III restriction enzyme
LIELYEFQERAAEQIADRFRRYYEDPPMRGTKKNGRVVPFYQALSSITASGKTVILAEAVSAMATVVAVAPIIIWLSKGKVVVEQSYANLVEGGKYHHLLAPVQVSTLAQYDADDVAEVSEPLVYFATVGTFNQKDKEGGDRAIFRSDIDVAETSTWEALKVRATGYGIRRPLIVVYDEAQNLSDQQTELLLELEPDAIVAASATMRQPQALANEVQRLRQEGWEDVDLITQVDAKAVAESGLVKSTVVLSGYEAPMEETISSLLSDMADASSDAIAYGVGPPKAIYVCKTNIVEGDSLQRDDPKRPFKERQAPPILIWRYLTEQGGIDADEIAVYCSLKFDRGFPPPPEFRLFGGGDKDYDTFIAGSYRHIIFNLGLQEGWDDPLAYFAYIDKSMESNVQVEQVIGRLLRQPDQQHYGAERLNMAQFYIRVDRKGVFNDLLDAVSTKLATDAPGIKLVKSPPGKPKPELIAPKVDKAVFETAYAPEDAVEPIQKLLDGMNDYRSDDGTNIKSKGSRTSVQRVVGDSTKPEFKWEEFEHTNMVSVRWLFNREVTRQCKGALRLAPTDAKKFDAMVGFDSAAQQDIARIAADVVESYTENVFLKQKRIDPYHVGATFVRRDEWTTFKNAVHDGYSDLNSLEISFATVLDETGLTWCRNPSRSGYAIPLISIGSTSNFYPDFLVWKGKDVFALDTTGPHLLIEKTGKKLLAVAPPKTGGGRLLVRLISPGKWNPKVEQEDTVGYTVWGQKPDGTLRATYADSVNAAVEQAITKNPR